MYQTLSILTLLVVGSLLFVVIPIYLIKKMIKPNNSNRFFVAIGCIVAWFAILLLGVPLINHLNQKHAIAKEQNEAREHSEAQQEAEATKLKAERKTKEESKKEIIRKAEKAQAEHLENKRTQVEQYFKSDKEPKILDAVWIKPNIFKVGVIDDGSSRDGLANYVCEVLKSDFGINEKRLRVEVIDIKVLVATDKWVELGQANCN